MHMWHTCSACFTGEVHNAREALLQDTKYKTVQDKGGEIENMKEEI
jgi:hypothetical protein